MTTHDALNILLKAAEKAVSLGWAPTGPAVLGVDYIIDPPTIVLHTEPLHSGDSGDIYFAEYFAIFEKSFAISFWGSTLEGDSFFGMLPAWQYHQHRLLFLLQWDATDQFFEYIENYL